ncbi:ABC transporter permease [Sporosarcina sp. NCCP-2716]|uniref:FtsX-like permease family protein n=1 Tax=Sporosarcina sp. NCCP-2716 TaxID=2943679 RepID=UPI002040D124|nr:ABC transporter permease [Sporosarcina sp. NCCP-2716]GKV69384.1 ABC transporter permease [Sporosarcina sp. NCCP-2716]
MTFRQFAYRNVVRNRRIYAAFFMASAFSVMVFFLYSMLLFHPAMEEGFVQEIASTGMMVAEFILFVFTLFFLFYSMRAFLQARSKEFGILLLLGMARSQLQRLIFLETMLIGGVAIVAGTFLGTVFSKFFLMIVEELIQLPDLPLYFTWKPFALTIGSFASVFIIISLVAPLFIRAGEVYDLLQGESAEQQAYSTTPWRAFAGMALLVLTYTMAVYATNPYVVRIIFVLPAAAVTGTYFFFSDSLPYVIQLFRSRKRLYWRPFWLLSLSEGVVRLKENARMFFIVTMVSTLAFMSVGLLASLTSFANQYRELNPLGLVYKSYPGNVLEQIHVRQLTDELNDKDIDYNVVPFRVLRQKSSFTDKNVSIVRVSSMNALGYTFGYPPIELADGTAMFLPPTDSSFRQLNDRNVRTKLEMSGLTVDISGAYPHQLFPPNAIGSNAIIVTDADFERILSGPDGNSATQFRYYAFNIRDWQETKDVGRALHEDELKSILLSGETGTLFSFGNPGLNYSVIRTTFSLLLFMGLLLAAVLFLAAGSFVYFRLYTTLDRDRRQFAVLRRMGITRKELKKIINRQLLPQFFIPWGVAFVHSAFAFLALQVIWDALAEISIAKELALVLGGFAILQISYFYLIRWRYLSHIRTPE